MPCSSMCATPSQRSCVLPVPIWPGTPSGGKKIAQTTRPELSDLLLGRAPGRRSERDITAFLNYAGLGYQFAATGHVIYEKARERGLGRELDTDLFTSALPS